MLIQKFGINGAAIGLFIAQLVSKSFLWKSTEKLSDIRFERLKTVYVLSIYTVSSFLIIYTIATFEQNFMFSFGLRIMILSISIILIMKTTIDSYLVIGLSKLRKELFSGMKSKK